MAAASSMPVVRWLWVQGMEVMPSSAAQHGLDGIDKVSWCFALQGP
jgi:hypothetical protein